MNFLSAKDKRIFTIKFLPLFALFSAFNIFIYPYSSLFLAHLNSNKTQNFSAKNFVNFKGHDYLIASDNQPHLLWWRHRGLLFKIDNSDFSLKDPVHFPGWTVASVGDNRGIWLFFRDHYILYDGNNLTESKPLGFKLPMLGNGLTIASDNQNICLIFWDNSQFHYRFLKDGKFSDEKLFPGPEAKRTRPQHQLICQHGKFLHFVFGHEDELFVQTIENGMISNWQQIKGGAKGYNKIGFDGNSLLLLGINLQPEVSKKHSSTVHYFLDSATLDGDHLSINNSQVINNIVAGYIFISLDSGNSRLYEDDILDWKYQIAVYKLDKDLKFNKKLIYQFNPSFFQYIKGYSIGLLCSAVNLIFMLLFSRQMASHKPIKITLPNGLHLEFASLLRRVIAALIDAQLLVLPATLLLLISFNRFSFNRNPILLMFLFVRLTAFSVILFSSYFILLEGIFGQTLGKKLMGIKIINLKGEPCGIPKSIIRNLIKLVDTFLLEYLIIAFSAKWQRLADMAADTVVVKVDPYFSKKTSP